MAVSWDMSGGWWSDSIADSASSRVWIFESDSTDQYKLNQSALTQASSLNIAASIWCQESFSKGTKNKTKKHRFYVFLFFLSAWPQADVACVLPESAGKHMTVCRVSMWIRSAHEGLINPTCLCFKLWDMLSRRAWWNACDVDTFCMFVLWKLLRVCVCLCLHCWSTPATVSLSVRCVRVFQQQTPQGFDKQATALQCKRHFFPWSLP